jgi:hypothetical protein
MWASYLWHARIFIFVHFDPHMGLPVELSSQVLVTPVQLAALMTKLAIIAPPQAANCQIHQFQWM